VFRRILIANRGEVATRIARTCHRLGIEVVAAVSEADRDQQWLEEADVVSVIGPARASGSYLDAGALVETAVHHHCSAVHPGWGFLAENALFAVRCAAAGLTFVGPSPEHLRAMGDKALARASMKALGMPVIPGTEEPVTDLEAARAAAEEIGYPLLIKAVAGGGGRGMRGVDAPEDLREAFESASA